MTTPTRQITPLYKCTMQPEPYLIKIEPDEFPSNTVDLLLTFDKAIATLLRVSFYIDDEAVAVINTSTSKRLGLQRVSLGYVPGCTEIGVSSAVPIDDVLLERVTLHAETEPVKAPVKAYILGSGKVLSANRASLEIGQLCFVTETPKDRVYYIKAYGLSTFNHMERAQVTLDGATWINHSDKAISRCISSSDAVITLDILEY